MTGDNLSSFLAAKMAAVEPPLRPTTKAVLLLVLHFGKVKMKCFAAVFG